MHATTTPFIKEAFTIPNRGFAHAVEALPYHIIHIYSMTDFNLPSIFVPLVVGLKNRNDGAKFSQCISWIIKHIFFIYDKNIVGVGSFRRMLCPIEQNET
ncbi:hypothetical protein ACJX0J_009571 [Zea mays]